MSATQAGSSFSGPFHFIEFVPRRSVSVVKSYCIDSLLSSCILCW